MCFSSQEQKHTTALPTEDYHRDLLTKQEVLLFQGWKEVTTVTGWKRMDMFVNC